LLKKHLVICLKQVLDTKMDNEIKYPELTKPKFFNEPYDYRNIENVGKYRGVGEAGKVGLNNSTSIDAMPPKKNEMLVPRDHKG